MDIKQIHLLLIVLSLLLTLFFAGWAFTNHYGAAGSVSLALTVGLLIYGVSFLRKVKKI